VYAVVCIGLRVLTASIRQCPSVEAWCHSSSQFIKWIFSQPLLHSACGQAVVSSEFHCWFHMHICLLFVGQFTMFEVFFYRLIICTLSNFEVVLHSFHRNCFCCGYLRFCIITLQCRDTGCDDMHYPVPGHTRWPNLTFISYSIFVLCYSIF